MIFVPKLALKVVDGEKTATRRAVSDNPRSPWRRKSLRYLEGMSFAVQPGRGAHGIAKAVVTKRAVEHLCAVTPADARKEGFATREEFVETWTKINGSFDPDELVHVIEFEIVPGSIDVDVVEQLRQHVAVAEAVQRS